MWYNSGPFLPYVSKIVFLKLKVFLANFFRTTAMQGTSYIRHKTELILFGFLATITHKLFEANSSFQVKFLRTA